MELYKKMGTILQNQMLIMQILDLELQKLEVYLLLGMI